jgi:amino acid transporter
MTWFPRMLDWAPDGAGVLGLVCLCRGAALLHPALGWIVAGLACLLVAWRLAVREVSTRGRSS